MSKYQSINIIVEDDPTDNYNYINDNKIAKTSSNSISSGICFGEDSLMDEERVDRSLCINKSNNGSTSYNDDYQKLEPSIRLKQNHFSTNMFFSISTLIFGIFFGLSIGYYFTSSPPSSENNFNNFESIIDSNNMSSKIPQNNDMKELENNIYKFIDSYIYQDSQALLDYNERSSPLLRFPFQGTSTVTPRPIIYLNRPDAYALLIDSMSATMSEFANDFFLISSGLDAQINQAYCGAASAVGLLNSLRFLRTSLNDNGVELPIDPRYAPYPYATQSDIFNDCTEKTVLSHAGVGGPGVDGILTPPYGLSMPQVAGLLRCHLNTTEDSGLGWNVQEQYVDKSHITSGKMRFDIKNALSDPNSRVLVNYDRSGLGQDGSGHWSPVGSYSDKHDAFLILDVAKYKYPPVWIPTERLFDAMATYDYCGSWNFPNGQDVLSNEERTTQTKEGYSAIMDKLGCEKMLRGYIVVTRTS